MHMQEDNSRGRGVPLIWTLFSAVLGGLVAVALSAGLRPTPVTAAPSSTAHLANMQEGFNQVAAEVCPAVVNINTEQHVKRVWGYDWSFDPFSDEMPEARPRTVTQTVSSLGSGLLISTSGYILTNQHVISGGTPSR